MLPSLIYSTTPSMAAAISRGTFASTVISMLPQTLRSYAFMASCAAQSSASAWSSIVPSASITIPAITLNIPDILSDIWEGVLRAVPKKKTSHMKKRHRQLAGKALKDVRSVNSCPACGRPKKAHTLCPYCVAGKSCFRGRLRTSSADSLSQRSRSRGGGKLRPEKVLSNEGLEPPNRTIFSNLSRCHRQQSYH